MMRKKSGRYIFKENKLGIIVNLYHMYDIKKYPRHRCHCLRKQITSWLYVIPFNYNS